MSASLSDELPLLLEIFARTVREHPSRVAIDVPPGRDRPRRKSVTYAELDRTSHAIAQVVADRVGDSYEPIVAILLPRDTPELYAAQLGALRAGAAFTCLDLSFPAEHVRAVLDDADASIVLTDARGVDRLTASGVDASRAVDVARIEPARERCPSRPIAPSQLAYAIYTSGTTGAPKGVLIEHRGIANLVRSDMDLFRLGTDDRVAQCSSPAYDSSLEETWLAFAVGATLVPLDDDTVRLGPDLVEWLARERITVLCPPPTLLRTAACDDPKRALPALRLLYVGGEALPQDLADRWGEGRWLENGYGPTECTVTVVRTRIWPGKPVTIGRPMAGHSAWIVDDALEEVPDGDEGELCIGGVGLARGYRNRPQATAEKFVQHPRYGRIYRTGDLVRRNTNGDIEYLGRIDGQVKLRGYRVELAAIDALLAQCSGVREAACRVQEDDGLQALVAHVVPMNEAVPPDAEVLRTALRGALPAYMVPSRFATISALPRTVGGKIDRKKLPNVALVLGADRRVREPRDACERAIVNAFAIATKSHSAVSIDDDFFLALGGDSLSAVSALCTLRADPSTASLAVRDIYELRTAERLAARAREGGSEPSGARRPRGRAGVRAADATVASIVQALWLAGGLVVSGTATYALAVQLLPRLAESVGLDWSIALAPFVTLVGLIAYAPLSIVLTALVQRALLGRVQAGSAPVYGSRYVRHWIVQQTARTIPWGLLEGTVFLNAALRALGARIGKRVHIHRGVDLRRGGWELLTIGDDVTLAQEAALRLVELRDGQIVFGPVTIGANCTIDVRAGVGQHSIMAAGASLAPLSWLAEGTTIPSGERWDGVPARRAGQTSAPPRDRRGTAIAPWMHGCVVIAARFATRLVVALPWMLIVWWITASRHDTIEDVLAWLAAPQLSAVNIAAILAISFVATPLSLIAQALSLRVMGRTRPGAVNRWSLEYLTIWTKSRSVDTAGRWLSGTLFWPIWLRLAGMRIGRGCEISTIIDVVPDTVSIGDTSFFADGIYFASPAVHQNVVTIAPTSLGHDTFLGNHAVVPAGHTYPPNYFVGVSTVADAAQARPGSAWFGHPAMELPRREVLVADRSLTHDPGVLRYSSRLFWESLRFALPVLPILVVLGWWKLILAADAIWSPAAVALVAAPIATTAAIAVLAGAIVGLKWLLLLRVRPGQHALWSCWCSRWDFLYVAWGFYARNFLQSLEGTVFLTWFLRAIGVHIGKRVILGSGFVQVVDPDMLTIEDDATVDCHFQAHSFEDRVLKIDRVRIGKGATLGHNAVVFYGADIGANAEIVAHSVVMKRAVLEGDRTFEGCPVAETR